MYYELTPEQLEYTIEKGHHFDGNGVLINLIDSPGHVDFSSEVTAALRVTDGALVVVDCVSGVCVQTETVLKQALYERVRPILFLNKVDLALITLQMPSEDLYQQFSRTIENFNVIISCVVDENSVMGPLMVDPRKGNVGFGSGLMGWAFDIPTLARIYNKFMSKPGQTPEQAKANIAKLTERLWGEWFYNVKTNKWLSRPSEGYERGFVVLFIDVIK
ncbi:hypothetical protein MXB_391, partial [Myxobolus squamalis]